MLAWHAERLAHDPLLLEHVRRRVALARARPPRPSYEAQGNTFGEGVLEAVANRAVRTHVQRLLLRPDELVDLRVRRNQLREGSLRERVQLLEPGDRHVAAAGAPVVACDVVVELPRAHDEAARVLGLNGCVMQHGGERAAGELAEVRRGISVAQEPLGRHHDQRSRVHVERLAAKQMEVLGCGRGVRHADVLVRSALQEALEPGARVLRPVALVAVWEHQREPRRLPPLRAARDDELVDDYLRAVDEVPELRLPEDQCVGGGNGVAVLEPECCVLGER
jgi:hypothetical protein